MSYNDLTVGLRLESGAKKESGRQAIELDQINSKICNVVQSSDSGTMASALPDHSASPNPEKSTNAQNQMAPDPIDLNMPATEIGFKTTRMLSQHLRPPKTGAADWQEMAEEMGFNFQLEIQNFALDPDPVRSVLSAWSTKPGSTVGKLMDILERIERFDVLHNLPSYLQTDCSRWRQRQAETQDPVQVPEVSGNYAMHSAAEELNVICLQDSPTGPRQMFDAYVCYADADFEFMHDLVKRLEAPPHNFKLCLGPRDLLPGGSHAIVTAEIIQNRCNKMLVILSPEFLMSPSCDYQTKFAVSLEPGARTKRIIPILVKPCTPPSIIRHITMCDFTKQDLRPWLWDRLCKAMSIK